jgi:hypothetical protein
MIMAKLRFYSQASMNFLTYLNQSKAEYKLSIFPDFSGVHEEFVRYLPHHYFRMNFRN